MPRYSLIELFYWLTVWIVGVSILRTLITAPFAVLVVSVWLFGTVLTCKALGGWAGVAYSVLVGFIFMAEFSWPTLTPVPRRRLSFGLHYSLSFVSALISGTTVWCIAAVVEQAFKSSRMTSAR